MLSACSDTLCRKSAPIIRSQCLAPTTLCISSTCSNTLNSLTSNIKRTSSAYPSSRQHLNHTSKLAKHRSHQKHPTPLPKKHGAVLPLPLPHSHSHKQHSRPPYPPPFIHSLQSQFQLHAPRPPVLPHTYPHLSRSRNFALNPRYRSHHRWGHLPFRRPGVVCVACAGCVAAEESGAVEGEERGVGEE